MPVLPNGQKLPYNNMPNMSDMAIGQVYDPTGQYLRQITENYLAATGQAPPLGGQLGMPQAMQSQQPRYSQQQGANPSPGMQMGPGGIFGGDRALADMELRRRAAMTGQGFGMPAWRAPARMTGNPMGMPAPAAGATMQRQMPAGMIPQMQSFAAQRMQQPGGQRLAGMQQGMSAGQSPQNLQGAATGAQDYVTNRRRGILGGVI